MLEASLPQSTTPKTDSAIIGFLGRDSIINREAPAPPVFTGGLNCLRADSIALLRVPIYLADLYEVISYLTATGPPTNP